MYYRYKLKNSSLVADRQSVCGVVLYKDKWFSSKYKIDKLIPFLEHLVDEEYFDEKKEFIEYSKQKVEEHQIEVKKQEDIKQQEIIKQTIAEEPKKTIFENIFNRRENKVEIEDLSTIIDAIKTKEDYEVMNKRDLINSIVNSNPNIYVYEDFIKENKIDLLHTIFNIKGIAY
jgi:hypothetical protein